MTIFPETPTRVLPEHTRSHYRIDCGSAQLDVHARNNATILRLDGEVDVSNANLVGKAVSRFCRLNAPLVLDLSQLKFLDIVGFRTLLSLNDENQRAELHCSLVGGPALRLLTGAFVDHGLPIVDSVTEALRVIDDRARARRGFRSGDPHQREPQREMPAPQ